MQSIKKEELTSIQLKIESETNYKLQNIVNIAIFKFLVSGILNFVDICFWPSSLLIGVQLLLAFHCY